MKKPDSRPRRGGGRAPPRSVRARIRARRRPAEIINEVELSMRSIRYSRFTGDDFGLTAEDLLRALSDFFLQSGFDNPYMQFSEWNQHTLEDLKHALEQALERGEFFD